MRVTSNITKTFLTLCTGAALAVAQTPATGQAGTTQPSAGSSNAPIEKHAGHKEDHGMNSSHGAGLMVGPQDQAFIINAAQGGMMEVEAARLAQQKASSNEIKEFARKLEQDHQAANEKLKALAAAKNVDLPSDMGKHRAMLDKVTAASGDNFDKQWMKMQVNHHKDDVNAFTKETTRAMDGDVRNFATSTLPTLQEHLRQAQELSGSTRGRSAPTSASKSSAAADSSAAGSSNSSGSSARPQGDNNPTTTK